MGQTEGDMRIDDPQLAPLQLHVFADGNSYLIQNLAPEVELRLNGKAINASAPLKERDSIVVGKATITFTRLDSSDHQAPPARYEHPNAAARFAPGTKERAIQEALEILAAGPVGSAPKPPTPPSVKPPLPPRK